jgi:hypothetical protein
LIYRVYILNVVIINKYRHEVKYIENIVIVKLEIVCYENIICFVAFEYLICFIKFKKYFLKRMLVFYYNNKIALSKVDMSYVLILILIK